MQYVPVLLAFVGALGVAALFWLAATFVAPRNAAGGVRLGTAPKPDPVKALPFESGLPSTPYRRRFTVKFYLIALFFILFDVETVFLVPLAVVYRELAWFAFAELVVFVGILSFGLLYVWRKGALEWT